MSTIARIYKPHRPALQGPLVERPRASGLLQRVVGLARPSLERLRRLVSLGALVRLVAYGSLERLRRLVPLGALRQVGQVGHASLERLRRLVPLGVLARLFGHASLERLRRYVPLGVLARLGALAALVLAMSGTWQLASAAPPTSPVATKSVFGEPSSNSSAAVRPGKKAVTGKLNLNTATEDQLMLLPSVGPAKAERIVTWRKKNGGFKRIADLRRVKGFGYKSFKRLEPFLDIQGDSTLVARR